MINLRNSPFLWIALVLLFTYVAGNLLDGIPTRILRITCLGCVMISATGAIVSYGAKRYYISTVAITMLIISAGLIHQQQVRDQYFPTPLVANSALSSGWVEVTQVLKRKEQSVSLRCRLLMLRRLSDSIDIVLHDQFVLLQIRDPDSLQFLPGDSIAAKGWISAISPPMNPHSFDARQYYITLGIRHQWFCKASDVQLHPSGRFSFSRLTARWQAALSGIVKAHTSASSAQVINALVWGDRADMDEEVRDAFADSGAMHVLSVSGMHVAMIYSLLFLLLGAPGDGSFLRRVVRFSMYAAAILLYVGLTGACPAVVRAGLMILLYLFGKSMGWNTQVWNLIGFAAFMMLWINPFLYHNVGFQLSFLAMAGILLFAKPIIRSLAFKTKLLHWTWEIIALSLAAQVFILPVILGQFHQFPLTFIASSIVAIPAGYVVIFGALLNVLLSIFNIELLWPLLDKSCTWFVDCMKWMAGLNPSMHYALPEASSFILMCLAILYSLSLVYRWQRGKQFAYSLCFVVILLQGYHRFKQWQTDELIIYHSYKGLVMDVFQNGYTYAFQSSDMMPSQVDFPTRGYRCHKDIVDVSTIHLDEQFKSNPIQYAGSMLDIKQVRLLIFHDQPVLPDSAIAVSHILILSCRHQEKLMQCIRSHAAADIILTASCPRADQRRVAAALHEEKRKWHDIGVIGFKRITL